MSHTCKSCSRTNPGEARYCYFDGALLNGQGGTAPVALGTQPFLHSFVFPNGRECQNFDQLALACWNDRPAAVEALKEGDLARFLSGIGRADLAKAARDAAKSANVDRALYDFLDRLPGSSIQEPKLDVQPHEIVLGPASVGQDRTFKLRLLNTGMRLLTGSISVKDAAWLSIGDKAGARKKVFQFVHDLEVPLQVHGKRLGASAKGQEATLVIESNGGNILVPVRVEVAVKPFPEGAAVGAVSPRQLAEKALKQPREMAPLFEKGAVAKWYSDNGWDYPVQGATSSGFGAIQQYFEALGMAKPPKVELSPLKVALHGKPGETLTQALEVQTQENRMVYAVGHTDQSWVKVEALPPKGKSAPLRLNVQVPDHPGETLEARVTIRSNGTQRFVVPVTLAIAGVRRATPPPIATLAESSPAVARPATLPMPEGFGRAPVAVQASVPSVPVARAVAPPAAPLPLPASLPMPEGFGPTPTAAQASAPKAPPRPASLPMPDGFTSTPTAAPPSAPKAAIQKPASLPMPDGFTAAPAAVVAPPDAGEPVIEEVDENPARYWHLLPGALLPLVLFGMFIIHDILVMPKAAPPPDLDVAEGPLDPTPRLAINFQEKLVADEPFDKVYTDIGPTMRFGLVMPLELIEFHDPQKPTAPPVVRPKQLTFDPKGRTNNTCLRIDGTENIFGQPPGRWVDFSSPLGKDPQGNERIGRRSVYLYPDQGIKVTQTVEIVRGQSRLLDTCLVRYLIENTDMKPHKVGLRVMLDTLIGINDGVPFLLPGRKGLCDTMAEFATVKEVPDFIQALESDNLEKPGTVAHLQLKLGDPLEPPSRVTLGAWPNPDLNDWKDRPAGMKDKFQQHLTKWDVPLLSMKTIQVVKPKMPPDSCVVMYWPEDMLAAGRSRLVGFSYGLESVKSSESGGKLALTVGGSFAVGGEFELAAYVKDPVAGQKLTLKLPDGLKLSSGGDTLEVPPLAADSTRPISTVTWRVVSTKAGRYTLKVQSSTGNEETKSVVVTQKTFLD